MTALLPHLPTTSALILQDAERILQGMAPVMQLLRNLGLRWMWE